MHKQPARWLTLLAAAMLPALTTLPAAAQRERGPLHPVAAAATEDPDGARVIVKYKALGSLMKQVQGAGAAAPTVRAQFAQSLGQRTGLALRDGHIIDRTTQVVHGDKSISSAALAARLAADPDVEYAVPDLRRHILAVPNDSLYGPYAGTPAPLPSGDTPVAVGQWYLRPTDSTVLAAINAETAWNLTTGSASVVIADIDTGALFGHPDLVNKLLPGRNFVSANGNLGSGWSADATDTGDWTTAGQCGSGQSATPSSWHGTQTASLLGAQTNNGIGMASVGYNIRVQPVRALGKCGGYDSDIIAAMYWAGGLADPTTGDPSVPANPTPAQVINMSLGGTGSCSAAYAGAIGALNAKGVVVVIAAGNAEGLAVSEPGNCPGAIAVAGVRHVGTKVGFSSLGPEVAIAAPGGNCVNTTGACLYPIITATNTGTTTSVSSGYTYSDSTNYAVGTSFATPMVAGTAALMLSVNPSLTPAQLKSLLQAHARAFPSQPAGATVPVCVAPSSAAQDECYCTTATCGAGLLDTNAAVAAAASTAAPTVSIAASSTSVSAGNTVTFTSAASAPGQPITSYQWAITSGASLATITSASNSATATVTTQGTASGSFTITLTVTDGAGETSSASSTVTVTPLVPTATISTAATTVTVGSNVTLDGSASTAPTGRTISSYQWSIISGSSSAALSGSTGNATATLATSAAGTVVVQLTVTDSAGAQSSKTVTIVVNAVTAAGGGSTGGGGGGGGAVSPIWPLFLLWAVVLLFRDGRRRA